MTPTDILLGWSGKPVRIHTGFATLDMILSHTKRNDGTYCFHPVITGIRTDGKTHCIQLHFEPEHIDYLRIDVAYHTEPHLEIRLNK